MRPIIYWILVLFWTALIFDLSTDFGAVHNSSRIITPVLRWFKPKITPGEIAQVHGVIRKGAHVAEYAILAIFLCFALRTSLLPRIHGWCWRTAGITLLLCAAYGASDEFHQSFSALRGPSFVDVLIDTAGALGGLTILWLCHRKPPLLPADPHASADSQSPLPL